jgi:hypothetical protein
LDTLTQIPSHHVRYDTDLNLATWWTCACGAAGGGRGGPPAYAQAGQHQQDAVRPFLVALDSGRLAAELRRTARGTWPAEPAVELLIAHDAWLHDETLRDEYLVTEWTTDGDVSIRVAWRGVAIGLGLVDRAVETLQWIGVPTNLLDQIRESDNDTMRRPPLEGSGSALAVLAIAASIAGGLPIQLHQDTTGLSDPDRGLVLAAIGHLLSRDDGAVS